MTSLVTPFAAGTYNDQIQRDKTLPCKACLFGTTTPTEGSDAATDCQRKSCAAGSSTQVLFSLNDKRRAASSMLHGPASVVQ